jgi:hypothetical protein
LFACTIWLIATCSFWIGDCTAPFNFNECLVDCFFFYSFSMHPQFHHSRWKILL